MINIQPYLDKLELLKEYLFLKIDSKGKGIMVDISGIPVMATEDVFKIYEQTGLILYYDGLPYERKELTFDEYYSSKVQLSVAYEKIKMMGNIEIKGWDATEAFNNHKK